MPCYRCGARQTDPARGPSPWRRGVRDGLQVLVCPRCQGEHDWASDMDHCPTCGAVTLVRSLGETRCRACGWAAEGPPGHGEPAPGLADDVAAAVRRVLDAGGGPAGSVNGPGA